jgi:hypothetical protein
LPRAAADRGAGSGDLRVLSSRNKRTCGVPRMREDAEVRFVFDSDYCGTFHHIGTPPAHQ